MSESIIDKLGIPKGQYKIGDPIRDLSNIGIYHGPASAVWVESPEMVQVKNTAAEMLEDLIDIRKFMERLPVEWYSEYRAVNIENTIQSATGKTWPEIKALLNEKP